MQWITGAPARAEFEAFVLDATDRLYRAAYFMTNDAAEAEDLVQETLVKVAAHWHKVRRSDRRLAYTRRTLVNLAIDGTRRRTIRRQELRTDAGDDLDSAAARAFGRVEDLAEIEAGLRILSRRQRAVLFLRYWEDLSEAETAEALGCSVGAVKKTTWRAVQRMRRHLGAGRSAASEPRLLNRRMEKGTNR